MKHLILSLAVACAAFVSAPAAHAAVIGTYDYDYTDTGNRGGQGRNQNADGVLITDNGSVFRDSFDFSGLAGATIDSLSLTFAFEGAGPSNLLFIPGLGNVRLERWFVIVEGNDPTGTGDDLFATLADNQSPWTGAITASTAPGNSFFDDALANLGFDFSFDQVGVGINNSFRLASVSLTVNGTAAVVPLPAPGILLLAALGGLLIARRRSTAAIA